LAGTPGRGCPPAPAAFAAAEAPGADAGTDALPAGSPPRAARPRPRALAKSIKTPDPVPLAGRVRALELMETGRLYRYNADGPESCEVSLAER